VLSTKRNFISVECGVGCYIPQHTNPCQILSHPLHFMTSFAIQNALKLCPTALTPNNLVWMLVSRNLLPPSSDSLLKTQTVYSYETQLSRPHGLNYKKELSELWPILETGHPVMGYSRSWVFCPSALNTYYCSCCLLPKIGRIS